MIATKTTRKTTKASAPKKFQCTVSYDVITKSDMVRHMVETIKTASREQLFKHLRIKNKSLGLVRNINIISEISLAA